MLLVVIKADKGERTGRAAAPPAPFISGMQIREPPPRSPSRGMGRAEEPAGTDNLGKQENLGVLSRGQQRSWWHEGTGSWGHHSPEPRTWHRQGLGCGCFLLKIFTWQPSDRFSGVSVLLQALRAAPRGQHSSTVLLFSPITSSEMRGCFHVVRASWKKFILGKASLGPVLIG